MLNNQEMLAPLLIEDLGRQFPKETSNERKRFGLYKCQCGKEFKAQTSSIKSGHTKSCGCHNMNVIKKRMTSHNMSYHPIFTAWSEMRQRCNNKNNHAYKDYGGRGISVCDRWLHSFENFRDDMFPKWEKGLSIDRINVNGNYEPSNCRWANRTTQNINKRKIQNTTSKYIGVSMTNKKHKYYSSYLSVGRKRVHLGSFKSEVEAVLKRNEYIINNRLEHPLNII